jgi:starvation-inducible outer membrane lipoprotein
VTKGPLLALLTAAALALAGCSSPEQKLVDRQRDLRDTLDRLYAAYAASGAGKADEAPKDAPEAGIVGRVLAEVDRTHFEQYCVAVGRGERPFSVSGRLEAFLQEPQHARECRRAADLAIELGSLEREVRGR